MFDIGFTELVVIGVVALIVIGPERLPKVARTAGHLYGRMQRYVSSVKSDISQEIQLDEMRRAGQSFRESIESAASGVEQQATVVDDFLRSEAREMGSGLTAITADEPERRMIDPAKPAVQDDMPRQQSLLLDEPDQNTVNHPPSTRVETARGASPKKTA